MCKKQEYVLYTWSFQKRPSHLHRLCNLLNISGIHVKEPPSPQANPPSPQYLTFTPDILTHLSDNKTGYPFLFFCEGGEGECETRFGLSFTRNSLRFNDLEPCEGGEGGFG